jgi:hypothetical protein
MGTQEKAAKGFADIIPTIRWRSQVDFGFSGNAAFSFQQNCRARRSLAAAAYLAF